MPPFSKIGSVLAIAAGKGGVGKSSVAVNLALSLQKRGFRVGLLDADVYGPSLAQMLPEGVEPAEDPQNPEWVIPAMTLGMPFISVAHFRKEASIVRAPIANSIIEKFIQRIQWGELDFLIIDFPPGTGDIQLTLMQKGAISAAVMVTTPQLVSLLDVRKAAQLFQKMEIPVVGVVENMSYFLDPSTKAKFTPFGSGGGKRLSQEFKVPFLGEIPIDPAISEGGDRGESLFEKAGDSPGAIAFTALCTTLLEKLKNLSYPVVAEVRQKDSHHLEIKMKDHWLTLKLHKIQKNCPCARCLEKKSREDVSMLEFSLIGRYAVRIIFSSGCSQGIYPIALLEKLAAEDIADRRV